jgi:hypothetical protein
MSDVILVMGYPASGKSTLVAESAAQGHRVLNRDTEGGSMSGLLGKFRDVLREPRCEAPRGVLDGRLLDAPGRDPNQRVGQEVEAKAWQFAHHAPTYARKYPP